MSHFKGGGFFGFEIHSPFIEVFSYNKIGEKGSPFLPFLSFEETIFQKVCALLDYVPHPFFQVGPVALLETCFLLRNRTLENLTLQIRRFGVDLIQPYQKLLHTYFIQEGCQPDRVPLTQSIVCKPVSFLQKSRTNGEQFPLYLLKLHLYKRCEEERYISIWTRPLLPPFKEVKQGNFILYGENFQQIFLHAQIALSFKFPAFTPFIDDTYQVRNLHDGGVRLLTLIYKACDVIKMPIKKAIFPDYGAKEQGLLKWELSVTYYD